MTSSLAPTPRPSAQAGLAVALTAAADYLLFGQPLGFSLLLFAALLAGGIATANAGSNEVSEWKYVLIPLALAPLYEAVSVLSVSIAALFLIAFALAASGQLRRGLASFAQQAAAFVLTIPVRLPMDFIRARLLRQRLGQGSTGFGWVAKWVMPLVLAMVFVGLFSIANPIVEHWLSLIDLRALLDLVEPERVVFWLLVVLVVWAFLRPRLPRIRKLSLGELSPGMAKVPPAIDAKAVVTVGDLIFSKAAILRALLVFNAIFAVQTALDAAYLWGGVALPGGMTYAEYAHRGAYPLIVTALLAAAFVLVAMRPGSETSANPLIRRLVYLWTAQNVVLMLSAILRLDLYVSIYALTYLRVAAFVWMGLVAVGLVLIMARIRLGRSNGWLVGANLAALTLTLYACCFVNFADIIARYNVEHSREILGEGLSVDDEYLIGLGPAAIPALDIFLQAPAAACEQSSTRLSQLMFHRNALAQAHDRLSTQWRAWTFRDWRLSIYLASSPVPSTRPCP